MKCLNKLAIVLGLAILGSGCGQEQYPEAPPGASRGMMENPLGSEGAKAARKASAKSDAAAAKGKEAGLKIDPRGK